MKQWIRIWRTLNHVSYVLIGLVDLFPEVLMTIPVDDALKVLARDLFDVVPLG
jgi:hypothetical protein